MAAPVSNINRLAKAGAPIPFQSTVLALRSLVGEPDNADIQHKMGNLFRHFDIIAAHQEQDPSSLLTSAAPEGRPGETKQLPSRGT